MQLAHPTWTDGQALDAIADPEESTARGGRRRQRLGSPVDDEERVGGSAAPEQVLERRRTSRAAPAEALTALPGRGAGALVPAAHGQVQFIEAVPKSAGGKILRRELRQREKEQNS